MPREVYDPQKPELEFHANRKAKPPAPKREVSIFARRWFMFLYGTFLTVAVIGILIFGNGFAKLTVAMKFHEKKSVAKGFAIVIAQTVTVLMKIRKKKIVVNVIAIVIAQNVTVSKVIQNYTNKSIQIDNSVINIICYNKFSLLIIH